MAVALLLLLENAFVISLINQVYTFTLDNYAIMYSPRSVEDHRKPQHFVQISSPPKWNNFASNPEYLLSKQTAHSSQHTVLLWVVRMIFAWNFENRGKGSGVGIDSVSYSVGDLCLWSSVCTS
jgi:hypothetical protein